jgi:hypothetical protein
VVMEMKKTNIITNNREIYEKFNMLNFSDEIVLKNVKPVQIERIIGKVNKNDKILHMEKIGEYFLVKKIGKVNYNVYLR